MVKCRNFTFRINTDEFDRLKFRAKESGLTMSEFVRERSLYESTLETKIDYLVFKVDKLCEVKK